MDRINFKGYQNIKAWQKGMELVTAIYNLTKNFPKTEIYGLSSQMRRSAVSIPSNIAEGYRRGQNTKDFHRFLSISFGSGAELETQIQIAKNLNYSTATDFTSIDNILSDVMKLLHTMIKHSK